jgi:phenylalanyl-tRNA synthetase beta chain
MLALTSGGDFFAVKGVLEALVARLNPAAELEVVDASLDLLRAGRACELRLNGERLGFLGEVGEQGLKQFELRSGTTAAEVRISQLAAIARLTPEYRELPAFPAIHRDINLELPEAVRWADVAAVVRQTSGEALEGLEFKEIYRNEALRAAGRKSMLFSLTLRSRQATLTNAEADAIRDRLVAACAERFAAVLRA